MQSVLNKAGQLHDSSKLGWQLWAFSINVSESGDSPETGVKAIYMVLFMIKVKWLFESHANTLNKADSTKENVDRFRVQVVQLTRVTYSNL